MSNIVKLERFAYTPQGTFGRITYGTFTSYTLERPWDGNKPFVSCIPEGTYQLQWYASPKFGPTWALLGDTVSLQPSSKARSAILVHSANTTDQLQGCIALGTTLGVLNGRWAVANSRSAVQSFLERSKGHDLRIEISQYHPT